MYDLKTFREILRLRTKGDSLSKISAQLKVPRSTLRGWFKVCEQSGFTYEGLKGMTLEAFLASVNRLRQPSCRCFQPDWNDILEDVSRNRRSLQLCFEDYLRRCPKGSQPMGRSAFYLRFRSLRDALPPEMHRLYLHNSFAAGSVAMIDYSGDGIDYVDTKKNKVCTAQIFVGVLGHSGMIFCRATPDQKRDSWLTAIADMFAAFGGVTEELWLDNATPLVIKASRLEPTLSPEFVNFCEQYDTEPRAVAPGEPTYKGLAENAVKQCQNFILKELAGRKFFSIEEINRAVACELAKLNARPLRERPETSRRKRFELEEVMWLRPLPAVPYAPGLKCFERKVLKGDQIRIENLRHNVPWGYTGKMLIIALDRTTGRIECRLKDTGALIHTTQLRTALQGDEPTRAELLPPELRLLAMSRNELLEHIEKDLHFPDHALRFAQTLGGQANSRAATHLRHLIRTSERMSPEALEAICTEVLSRADVSIQTFEKVRAKSLSRHDRETIETGWKIDISGQKDKSEYRGADYFKTTGEKK